MKRHLQCAEQQVSRSNLTEYCACHAERLTYLVLITYETKFTVRGATGLPLQHHQIQRLPHKIPCPNFWQNLWKQVKRHFQCENDPSMIRAWKRQPQPASQVRLLFQVPRSIFYCKIQRFAPNLTFKPSPSAATCHKKMTLELHQVLHLPRKVTLELHQILRLPRKVTLELHQVLRLPRKVTLELHQVLHLPRKVTLELHQVLHLPTTKSNTWTSPSTAPATKSDTWTSPKYCDLLLYLTLTLLDTTLLDSTWLYYSELDSTLLDLTLLDTTLLDTTLLDSTWHYSTWLYLTLLYLTLLDSTLLDSTLLDSTLLTWLYST